MNLRNYLKTTASTAFSLTALSMLNKMSYAKNDEIVMAVVGIHGMGRGHLKIFSGLPGVRVKTICEIDERLYPGAEKYANDIGVEKVNFEYDLRRVLDDKDIDAISIATPEQWHALMAIWGCQAGKDVYVEKPVSHNIWEGRKIIEAARKYNRIVEAGTQQRSYPHVREAMRLLHEGVIGTVYMAKGLCYKPRNSIGRKQDSPIPAGVHYDLWLGPAPWKPFNENRFHYNWHWFWDYGCGDIGNQGPHEMDVARWGLSKDTLPKKIHSVGDYYAFDSDQETPNTQGAVYEWDDGKILQFEVRGLYTNADDNILIGNLFYGSEGWMHVDINGFQTYHGRDNITGPSMEAVIISDDDAVGGPAGFVEGNAHNSSRIMHYMNFIKAVRAQDVTRLTADISEGHITSSLSHLANISYRLGRELRFNSHTETFVGDEQADGYLTRNYRYPYIVPDKV